MQLFAQSKLCRWWFRNVPPIQHLQLTENSKWHRNSRNIVKIHCISHYNSNLEAPCNFLHNQNCVVGGFEMSRQYSTCNWLRIRNDTEIQETYLKYIVLVITILIWRRHATFCTIKIVSLVVSKCPANTALAIDWEFEMTQKFKKHS
jgi:hypothetical protein